MPAAWRDGEDRHAKRGPRAPFDAVEHLLNLAMQSELGTGAVEQLGDLGGRERPSDAALVVEARRCAEPAGARRRALQLGDRFGDERRVDTDFGGDLRDLGERALHTAAIGAFLQLGGALEDERHLLLGVARGRRDVGHDERNMRQRRRHRQRMPRFASGFGLLLSFAGALVILTQPAAHRHCLLRRLRRDRERLLDLDQFARIDVLDVRFLADLVERFLDLVLEAVELRA